MVKNVSFYLILAFSTLTVLSSYPSNSATIESWLHPIRLAIICMVLTAAVCLSKGQCLGFLPAAPLQPTQKFESFLDLHFFHTVSSSVLRSQSLDIHFTRQS